MSKPAFEPDFSELGIVFGDECPPLRRDAVAIITLKHHLPCKRPLKYRETAERKERMRSETELEREKLRASEERLVETGRLYGELQRSEAFLAQEQKNCES